MKQPAPPHFISRQVVDAEYFYLNLSPLPDALFCVVCSGRETCSEDYCIEREDFVYTAVEFVAAGEGTLTLAGRDYRLTPGCLFCYGPETPHRLRALGPGLIKYFVVFAGTQASLRVDRSGLAIGSLKHSSQRRWVRDILDQLNACAELSRERAVRAAQLLVELLLVRIEQDIQTGPGTASSSARTYRRCREYLREAFRKVASVEEAADACGVSPSYLVRLFQRYSDESAYSLLRRLKMDHAADLLIGRNDSIASVAQAVGYSDPYHFSRVFKKHHGVAPRYFREELRRAPE